MNIVKEELQNQAMLLKITVTEADYGEAVNKTLKDYRKKANVPGFRPGMVPMGIINKMYKKRVTAEESYREASKACMNYLQENKIEILGEPMPSETQPELDFDNATEFEFHFELGLAPEVNVDLSKVKITKYNIPVEDKMREGYKENYLRRFGKLVDVEEATSDEALSGTLEQEGKTIEKAYVGLIGMSEEERKPFIGKKKGDKIEVDVNELYKQPSQRAAILSVKEEELEGIDPKFTFTIEQIQKFQNPEMNEEFFKQAFPSGDVTTEEQFDSMIEKQIERDLERETDYKFIDDTKKAVIEAAKLALPVPFLKNWLYAINEGKFTKEAIDKNFSQFEEMMSWDILKRHFAGEAKTEVSPEEAKQEAKALAAQQFAYYGMPNVEENMLENYASSILGNKEEARKIYDRLAERKVVDYIAGKAKVTNKKITAEAFGKLINPVPEAE